MPDPKNYILDIKDPLDQVMRGFEVGTNIRRQPLLEQRDREDRERELLLRGRDDIKFGQQQTLFGQGQEDRATAQSDIEQKTAEANRMKADLLELQQNPTLDNYTRMIATHPQFKAQFESVFNPLDEANKQSAVLHLGQVYSAVLSGNTDIAEGMLQSRADALRSSGNEDGAKQAEAKLALLRADPSAAEVSMGLALAAIAPDTLAAANGETDRVQSSQNYKNGTVVNTMSDGTLQVVTVDGGVATGADAAAAVSAGIESGVSFARDTSAGRESGKLETQVELSGVVEQTKALAKLAASLVGENLKSYNLVRTNIANYGQAIAALDRGAKTGAVQQFFPNVTAASIELGNVRSRLGLDIIGAATFGALSKGELDLALSTALPEDMDEPALRDWLVRKRNAQEKMATELYKAAAFLADPSNTMEDYLGTIEQPTPDAPEGPSALNGVQDLLNQSWGN